MRAVVKLITENKLVNTYEQTNRLLIKFLAIPTGR